MKKRVSTRKGVSVSNDGVQPPALEVAQGLLTREQVSELLQVGTVTVARMTYRGVLPAVRLSSNTVRYRRSDIEAYINSKLS
jgi:excisionase family DNA binding protein